MALVFDPWEDEAAPEKPTFLENVADTGRAVAIGGLEGVVAPALAGLDKVRRSFRDTLPPDRQALTLADDEWNDRARKVTNITADTLRKGMSETNQKAVDAALFPDPGQASLLDSPVRSSIMKLGTMAVPLAGLAMTGGVAAPAILGGVQAAGQQLNEADKEAMETPAEILEQKYPNFRTAIEIGLPEDLARKELRDALQSGKAILIAGAGGAAGGGFLAHALRGTAGKTFLKATGVGTLDAVAGGLASGAGTEAGKQAGEIEAGALDEYDVGNILRKGANTAVESAPLGVGFGAYSGVRGAAARSVERARARLTNTPDVDAVTVEGNNATPEQKAALNQEAEVPPTEISALDRMVQEEQAKEPQSIPGVVEPTPEVASTPDALTPDKLVVIKEAVHNATKVNTKYTAIEGAISRALKEANLPPLATGEPLRVISDMMRDGEIKGSRRGYRTLREPIAEPVVTPEAPVPLTPEAATAIVNTPEALPAEVIPNVPGDLPSKAAESLPTDIVEAFTKAPLAAKTLTHEVAEAAGIKPDSSTAKKLSLKVAPKLEAQKAKADAEAAENARLRAEGKPVVLRKLVKKEDLVKKATDEAKVEFQAEEAKRKVAARKKARAENDNKAKDIIQDQWKGEDGKIDEVALSSTEAKAATGDEQAIGQIVAKANALVEFAREKNVDVTRQPWSKDEKENKNPAPWATHIKEAERLVALAKNYTKLTPQGKQDVRERVNDFIKATRSLRAGDIEGAHASRLSRNEDVTRAAREARRGEDGNPNFDKKSIYRDDAPIEPNYSEVPKGWDKVDGAEPVERVRAPRDGKWTQYIHERTIPAPKAFWDGVNASDISMSAADTLRKIKFGAGRGQFGLLADSVSKRLADLIGDAKFVIVPDEVTEHLGKGVQGVYFVPPDSSFGARQDIIILSESAANRPLVQIHEAVHVATSRQLQSDKVLREHVDSLLKEVSDYWAKVDPDALKKYGFKNSHEFLAEALSNADFQTLLRNTPIADQAKYGTSLWGKVSDSWEALVRLVARSFGFNRGQMNALEAAMRAADDAFAFTDYARRLESANTPVQELEPAFSIRDTLQDLPSEVISRTARQFDREAGTTWQLRTQKWLDKIATVKQLAYTSDNDFGPTQPARKLEEAMSKAATHRDELIRKDLPLVSDLFDAERAFTSGGKWDQFSDFILDETISGAFADRAIKDQKQLGKDNPQFWQAKAQQPGLAKRLGELPAGLQAMRNRMHTYFKSRQDEMAMSLIKNTLRAMSPDGKGSDALAQRIFDRKLTDADKRVIGGDAGLSALREAVKVARVKGPYVPLMRRGDIVVQGRYELKTPDDGKNGSARRLNPDETVDTTGKSNIFEFRDEAAAKKFVSDLPLKVTEAKRVWVEPATGSRYGIDKDGTKVLMTKDEPSAEQRIRVTVQDKHVEFHKDIRTATTAKKNLISQGLKDIADLDYKRVNAAAVNNSFMPQQITNMLNQLEKRSGFKAMEPAAQQELRRQLTEAGLMSMATTRAQTRRLPRTNVQGASGDLTVNTQEYSSSTAAYLGRLKHQPAVDAALKEMDEFTNKSNQAGDDRAQLRRRQRLQELQRRVYVTNQPEPSTLFNNVVSRVLQISHLDKLASPAYHVINSVEPWTVSAPILGGRHGLLRAVGALTKAYDAIGGAGAVALGFKDTGRALRKNAGLTDHSQRIADIVKSQPDGKDLHDLMNRMIDTGLMSRDAGMEMARLINPDANMLGRAINRADLMSRQMGTAIESINRSTTAIAAYRLERQRGRTPEAAKKYALEIVHDTMGDYASWNAPPVFNHPLGRLALQFKKYAQKTYYLLGKQAKLALKGDKEAMKAFVGLMATHMSMAGALGLPLEVIKLGMLAAGLAGITDKGYDDFEQGVRKGASNVFGKDMGEILTRGLPRWFGVDVSSRVSLASLVTPPTDPKSMKKDDLYTYVAKAMMGAPADYVFDFVQGMQALKDHDPVEAAKLLVPIKLWADSVAAIQLATNGKQSKTGKQYMDPIRIDQAIVKALGFQPGAVAEAQEASFALRGAQTKLREDRNKLIGDWVSSDPSGRGAQLKKINAWNKDQPANSQITFAQLSQAHQRRSSEQQRQEYPKGVHLNKREEHLRGSFSFYNN